VAVEVRAEPRCHQKGWREDRGGRAGHVGGGGVTAPDLAKKEAKRHVVRLVLGDGVEDVVRMVWGWRHDERGEYQ
jgi:hypothetical protein